VPAARVAGDVDPALQCSQRRDEPVDVDRHRTTDAHWRDERRKIANELHLLGLLVGDEEQRRVDLGHGPEAPERLLLAPQLLQRGGGRRHPEYAPAA
jgi:hypothetical protein